MQTSQEDWSEEHSITESIAVEVEPGKSVYIWQFRLGFSNSATDVLFSRDIAITNTSDPPDTIPLPKI